ncbi:hypothetical protein [Primorskyibacter sp. S187A]|uniref:hypothetical protein n=1 Tax=Primorskyibacter sp. S187A TaxID=3415130 RepID=UPI003C7A58BE
MTIANLKIELSPGADADTAAHFIESRFTAAPEIEKSIVAEDTDRFGVAETVAVIAASVVLVKEGTELLEALRKFVKTAQALVTEGKALKGALIEVEGETLDAATASDDDVKALVARIASES